MEFEHWHESFRHFLRTEEGILILAAIDDLAAAASRFEAAATALEGALANATSAGTGTPDEALQPVTDALNAAAATAEAAVAPPAPPA